MTDDIERTVRSHVRAAIDGQVNERAELAARVILADIEKDAARRTDWRPPADTCLSQIVATRIRILRHALGMNRDELAARFNDFAVGGRMTSEALANIETGRMKDGQRRRMVSVDELVVFAKAFGVTPGALMDPNATGAMAVALALGAERRGVS